MTSEIVARLTASGYITSVATFGGCIPFPGYRTSSRDCNAANTAMYNHVAGSRYNLIVLAFRSQPVLDNDYKLIAAPDTGVPSDSPVDAQRIIRTGLKRLMKTGAKVIVFEPVPEMSKDIGFFARKYFAYDKDHEKINISAPFADYLERSQKMLGILESFNDPNVAVIRTSKIMCDGIDLACPGMELGVALYADDNHLSRFGIAKLFAGVDRSPPW